MVPTSVPKYKNLHSPLIISCELAIPLQLEHKSLQNSCWVAACPRPCPSSPSDQSASGLPHPTQSSKKGSTPFDTCRVSLLMPTCPSSSQCLLPFLPSSPLSSPFLFLLSSSLFSSLVTPLIFLVCLIPNTIQRNFSFWM